MHNWTIKKQIILGLSVLILINIVGGIFTSSGITKLKSFVQNITANELRGVYVVGQMQSIENEAYDLMLHHILAETQEETAAYDARLNEAHSKMEKLVADYGQTSPLGQQESAMFARVLTDRAAFLKSWEPVRELSLQLKNKEAFALFKAQTAPAFEKLKAALQDEIDYDKQIADIAAQQSIAVTDQTSTGVNLSIIVMLSVCVMIAYLIVRSLNRVLTSVADSLGEGANQIVASSPPRVNRSPTGPTSKPPRWKKQAPRWNKLAA